MRGKVRNIPRRASKDSYSSQAMKICGSPTARRQAQLFHLLRAQALHPMKKPLVLFTPKAILRHPACVSSINDLTQGGFQEVIDDPTLVQNPRKLFFCSGKVYYDLVQEREKRKISDVAFVRIEQLYPFPEERK